MPQQIHNQEGKGLLNIKPILYINNVIVDKVLCITVFTAKPYSNYILNPNVSIVFSKNNKNKKTQ